MAVISAALTLTGAPDSFWISISCASAALRIAVQASTISTPGQPFRVTRESGVMGMRGSYPSASPEQLQTELHLSGCRGCARNGSCRTRKTGGVLVGGRREHDQVRS